MGSLQSFRTSLRDHGGHEGDEGRCARDDRRRSDEEDCRVYTAQDEGREGCPRRPADHRLRRGEEDREVRDPATHDAEAEARAPRKAGKKMMFGKEVKVAAKPASKVVKAFPAKASRTRSESPEAGLRGAS